MKRKKSKLTKEDLKYLDLNLRNDCYVAKIAVSPSDWDTNPLSVDLDWKIFYRFKDPQFLDKYEYGKMIQVRGMNNALTWESKKAITKALREEVRIQLVEHHFNPITKEYFEEEPTLEEKDYIISPRTSWPNALLRAMEVLNLSADNKRDMKSMVTFLNAAIKELKFENVEIAKVTRVQLIKVLEHCKKSPNRHNKYISYCSKLWKEFKIIQAVNENIVTDIPKKTIIKDETLTKSTLTLEERRKIDNHLYEKCYNFWRFMQIFFHSGGRERELLRIKVKDVDLEKQQYKVLILKRRVPTIVYKPIKDCIKHLWAEVIKGAPKEAYVFSDDLCPKIKSTPIRGDQIGRRWRTWVKKDPKLKNSNGLGINKNFYDLKHLHSTEVVNKVTDYLNIEMAQQIASEFNDHTSRNMVDKIYDVESANRKQDLFKKINISFVGD